MVRGGRLRWLLLGLLTTAAAGCANEGVKSTLAGRGSFPDGETPSVTFEVRPLGPPCGPVGTQLVVLATLRDPDGSPARHRRLEWMLEGAGHIIEVDEAGFFSQGMKVDNHYAVTYTNFRGETVSRFNNRPQDDFPVGPGQSWCVLTSAVEGDAVLTVRAPGIANWDKNHVVLNLRWINARWRYPEPLTARAGSEQVLTTSVERESDRTPLPGCKVRYKILDGPPAVLVPHHTRETTATTDLSGFASVAIRQHEPVLGRNRVLVQIVRPAEPHSAGAAPVVLDEHETVVDWQAPQVVLEPEAPASMTVNRETTYALVLHNNGPVASQAMTVRSRLPEGVEFVRSEPPAHIDGHDLVWTLGELTGKGERKVLVTVKPLQVGTLTSRARVVTSEQQRDEKTLTVQVVPPPQPKLEVKLEAPATALAAPASGGGTPLPLVCRVTVSNPGTGPATNVKLTATFTANLRHASGKNPVELSVGTVAAGASVPLNLPLTPTQAGEAGVQVQANADDNLQARASHALCVDEAGLTLTMTGPTLTFAGKQVAWDLVAVNVGKLPLRDVVLRDQPPAEVAFVSATEGGQLIGNEVVWRLGAVQPGERKTVRLLANANQLTPKALNTAMASATAGEGPTAAVLSARAEAVLAVQGLPRIEIKTKPPGPLHAGERATYEVRVLNSGTLAGEQVKVAVSVGPQLKVVGGAGPGAGQFADARIEFPPVPSLPPQRDVVYTVTVEGAKAGEGRLTVEVSSPSLGDRPLPKQDSVAVQ